MSDDDSQTDAEELLQQSKEQSRHTAEPTTSSPEVDRVETIKDALLAIEDGDAPENINIRDARLKALLVGLEEADELDAVVSDVADALDTDVEADSATQSDLARLLIRAGLQETLPDVLDDATEARQAAVLEQTNDF